jgi:hypothetical protein
MPFHHARFGVHASIAAAARHSFAVVLLRSWGAMSGRPALATYVGYLFDLGENP